MKTIREPVRSLEQEETGEMRRLCCLACGRRFFRSLEELNRHQALCVQMQPGPIAIKTT